MIRKIITFILSLLLTITILPVQYSYGQTNAAPELKDANEFGAFIDSVFDKKMKELNIPGAVFVFVKDGKVFYSKGYGYADIEKKVPVTADKTLFRIGSITKLFTADSIMQLYEGGKIDLKQDVNTYLKDFKLKNSYSKPVTVEMLLNHTSGIDDQRIDDLSKNKSDVRPLNDFLKLHMMPVVREPGSMINYSSYDSALAGCIVEQVSGMTFDKYMDDKILGPLGMVSTGMNLNSPELSLGYSYQNGKYTTKKMEGYLNIYPAGAIISTGDDMAKYMITHLNYGEYNNNRILGKSTAENMYRQHAAFDRYLPGMAYGFNERYSNGIRGIEHQGYSPDNILSELCLFPEYNMGVYVSINQGMNNFPSDLVDIITEKYFPTNKKDILSEQAAQFNGSASKVEGTYRFSEGNNKSTLFKAGSYPFGKDITITKNEDNSITLNGKDPFTSKDIKITAAEVEPLIYKETDSDKYIIFKQDDRGRINYMAQTETSWHGIYERLKWYEMPGLHIVVSLFCIFVFILGFIIQSIMFIKRLIKKQPLISKKQKLISILTFAICLLFPLFFILCFYLLGEPTLYGVDIYGRLLLCVPIICCIVTAILSLLSVQAWIGKLFRAKERVYYSVISVAGVMFIWFINFWNLLGFKY